MPLKAEKHVIDWLPAYVLNTLADEETRQLKEHVATCSFCQAELARYQQVVDELPLAVPQAIPSPALKEKLMRAVHSRQGARERSPSSRVQVSSDLRKISSFFTKPLPAFGLAIIILLVVSNFLLWRQLNLISRQASASLRMVRLENTQFSQGAIGTLIMEPEGKYGTLVVDNLAPLSVDQQYQVWLIKSAVRTNGGVFSVNPEGYASLEIYAPLPLINYDAIGISIEPAGGSPAPTGVNVFHGVLAK